MRLDAQLSRPKSRPMIMGLWLREFSPVNILRDIQSIAVIPAVFLAFIIAKLESVMTTRRRIAIVAVWGWWMAGLEAGCTGDWRIRCNGGGIQSNGSGD